MNAMVANTIVNWLLAVIIGCGVVLLVVPLLARRVFRAYFNEKLSHLRTTLGIANEKELE
jgi:hypothetical protein